MHISSMHKPKSRLEWLAQGNERKLEYSITKLMGTLINKFQECIYFNMHMVKSIYFRVGIADLLTK